MWYIVGDHCAMWLHVLWIIKYVYLPYFNQVKNRQGASVCVVVYILITRVPIPNHPPNDSEGLRQLTDSIKWQMEDVREAEAPQAAALSMVLNSIARSHPPSPGLTGFVSFLKMWSPKTVISPGAGPDRVNSAPGDSGYVSHGCYGAAPLTSRGQPWASARDPHFTSPVSSLSDRLWTHSSVRF